MYTRLKDYIIDPNNPQKFTQDVYFLKYRLIYRDFYRVCVNSFNNDSYSYRCF